MGITWNTFISKSAILKDNADMDVPYIRLNTVDINR